MSSKIPRVLIDETPVKNCAFRENLLTVIISRLTDSPLGPPLQEEYWYIENGGTLTEVLALPMQTPARPY